LRFVGSLLRLSYLDGLAGFLAVTGVLLKEFGNDMLGLSRRIKHASERLAETTVSGRVHYLSTHYPTPVNWSVRCSAAWLRCNLAGDTEGSSSRQSTGGSPKGESPPMGHGSDPRFNA